MLPEKAIITTRNPEETYKIGQLLGELIETPVVIALNGELGTGKTVLVKGAARGLEVIKPVRSPTFTIMSIYQGRLPLYHFDFYRLVDESELEPLGIEEYLDGGEGAVFIEWAGKFPDILPPERLDIELVYDAPGEDNDRRELSFYPRNNFYSQLTDNLVKAVERDYLGKID